MPQPPKYTPPQPPLWATYVQDRVPAFKVHNNGGHAKNAVCLEFYRGVRGGTIYRLGGPKGSEEWQEWFVVPSGARRQDIRFPDSDG